MPLLWPDETQVKLKYQWENLVNTVAPNQYYLQTFRGNSMYDPDFSGLGNQPIGFDQWAYLYKNYRVNGCAIRATFMNFTSADADAIAPYELYIVPLTDTTLSFPTSGALEGFPSTRKTLIAPSSGSANLRTVKHYHTTRKMFPSTGIKDANFSAAIGANSSSQWYFHVLLRNCLGASYGCYGYLKVEITYYASLWNRTQVDNS